MLKKIAENKVWVWRLLVVVLLLWNIYETREAQNAADDWDLDQLRSNLEDKIEAVGGKIDDVQSKVNNIAERVRAY